MEHPALCPELFSCGLDHTTYWWYYGKALVMESRVENSPHCHISKSVPILGVTSPVRGVPTLLLMDEYVFSLAVISLSVHWCPPSFPHGAVSTTTWQRGLSSSREHRPAGAHKALMTVWYCNSPEGHAWSPLLTAGQLKFPTSLCQILLCFNWLHYALYLSKKGNGKQHTRRHVRSVSKEVIHEHLCSAHSEHCLLVYVCVMLLTLSHTHINITPN